MLNTKVTQLIYVNSVNAEHRNILNIGVTTLFFVRGGGTKDIALARYNRRNLSTELVQRLNPLLDKKKSRFEKLYYAVSRIYITD